MDRIDSICKNILALTDSEIAECETVISSQIAYAHPFKQGKQKELIESGKHNLAVLEQIKALRVLLISGNPVK